MYRAIVLFCCFLIFTPYSTLAMTPEQLAKIHERFEIAGMECIKDNPISEDDIASLKANKIATGENVPCFLACMMRNLGVMDDKGMVSKENSMELAKKVFEDPEEIKNIEDYLHSCSHINSEAVGDGEKGCERAILAYNCMKDNASKFHFDM